MQLLTAAYARYSTSLQQETSIAAQLKAIDDFCSHNNLTLAGMPYVDEAKTGTNMQRDGMIRLMRDARAGKFKAIVIYDISRGSRNLEDWLAFRREMNHIGVKVFSVTSSIGNLDNPADFLNETVQAAVGQFYVLQSRQKSIAGKAIRAERGLFCGGYAPLGYDIVEGRYVLNPIEAPVVRMIFDMYASGRSYSEIIAEVIKTGVTGKRGQPIAPNTLYYILKNERYAGTYVWNEFEMRHMHNWVGKKNASDDVIRMPGVIPAIVSLSVWQAVQSRMAANIHNSMNNTRAQGRFYLLSGIIRCGVCGGPLAGVTTSSKSHSYKKYICINKRKSLHCHAKDIRADKLEAYIVDFLRSRVLVPEVISAMVDKIMAIVSPSGEREALLQEVASLEKKNARLFSAIENGLSSPDTISRINENADRVKALQSRLANLPIVSPVSRASIESILLSDMRSVLDTVCSQQLMIRKYIQSVTIFDDYIELAVSPNLNAYTKKETPLTNSLKLVNGAGSPGRI
jgi:site-specific DNA recombinase